MLEQEAMFFESIEIKGVYDSYWLLGGLVFVFGGANFA